MKARELSPDDPKLILNKNKFMKLSIGNFVNLENNFDLHKN